MTSRHRFIILAVCAALFVASVPFLVLYSLGYRVDFSSFKITATGGIYVHALPQGATVTIDGKIKNTTGLFFNSVFVQNLLPKTHQVDISKDGYDSYQKTLPVVGNQVTKLEHVLLFKKNIAFTKVADADAFSISPDGQTIITATQTAQTVSFAQINAFNQTQTDAGSIALKGSIGKAIWAQDSSQALIPVGSRYVLVNAKPSIRAQLSDLPAGATQPEFDPQNLLATYYLLHQNLYASDAPAAPVAQKVLAYAVSGQEIIWLTVDGSLWQKPLLNGASAEISTANFAVNPSHQYLLSASPQITLLQDNQSLSFFDPTTGTFAPLDSSVASATLSPDGQKLLTCGDHEVRYLLLDSRPMLSAFLKRFSSAVANCQWLNNDYVAFTEDNNIDISEIDPRGNVNIVQWSRALQTDNQSVVLTDPSIAYNRPQKELYVRTQGQLLVSEPLEP